MKFIDGLEILIITSVLLSCYGQRDSSLPISANSFRQIQRIKITVPEGRSASLSDVIFRHYGTNTTIPTSYRVKEARKLLTDANFKLNRPTVLYAHGYVELTTDESVQTIIRAYMQHGGYNILVLDWANLGFGNYIAAALDLKPISTEVGKALSVLLKNGLPLEDLHFVGHSMGAHLLALTARNLASRGYKVKRLTGLDPAYPGFYPPLLAAAMTPRDAGYVDVIHTDGGGYGAPSSTGQADFWPNGGYAKQPGCISATVPFTSEDFCSHWRSWAFWAESVAGGRFLARRCDDHDSFLRGECQGEELVHMGLKASAELQGNFYLRTAAREPFGLDERGAS